MNLTKLSNTKMSLFALIAVIATFTLPAETFIGATSVTNRLIVATNEALVIHKFVSYSSSYYQIVKEGTNYQLRAPAPLAEEVTPLRLAAIAGPCEIIVTNQTLLNFYRIKSSNIRTILLPPVSTNATFVVSVSSGQNLRIFSLSTENFSVRRGTELVGYPGVSQRGNDEFSGPLEIIIERLTSELPEMFSYLLSEEAQVVPQGATVQSPTGSFQLMVEKSSNLTNWNPAILQSLTDEQKAFYRLRIQK